MSYAKIFDDYLKYVNNERLIKLNSNDASKCQQYKDNIQKICQGKCAEIKKLHQLEDDYDTINNSKTNSDSKDNQLKNEIKVKEQVAIKNNLDEEAFKYFIELENLAKVAANQEEKDNAALNAEEQIANIKTR